MQQHVFTVVGVLPRRFTGIVVAELMTRAFDACCADGQLAPPYLRSKRGQRVVFPDISRGITVGKFDARELFARVLYTLMAGVAIILLIACTSVGNLLLARATARSRELAVRRSLGASRMRIVRQLLAESALLAMLGTLTGVLFAMWGTSALAGRLPGILRILQPYVAFTPNVPVLGFAAGAAITCTVFFGVLPAIRATKLSPAMTDDPHARWAGGGPRLVDLRIDRTSPVTLRH